MILEPNVTVSQELKITSCLVTLGYMETSGTKQAFAARFNELCDEKGVPPKGKGRQERVAKIFSVSQKGARKWLEAESLPTSEKMNEIAMWGGVYVEWLKTGRGEKYVGYECLSEQISEVHKIMQPLPEELQGTILRVVRAMAESDEGDST